MAIEKDVVKVLLERHSKKYLDKLITIKSDGSAMFRDVGSVGPMDFPYMDRTARRVFELVDEMRGIKPATSGKKIERVPLKKEQVERVPLKTNKKEVVMAKRIDAAGSCRG